MGIVSSAKSLLQDIKNDNDEFQSPMGIVSSAKKMLHKCSFISLVVSIPDGDSFLREVECFGVSLIFNNCFNPRWG